MSCFVAKKQSYLEKYFSFIKFPDDCGDSIVFIMNL